MSAEGTKPWSTPVDSGVPENRNQLCALMVLSNRFFPFSYFPPPYLSSPLLAFAKAPEVGDKAACFSRDFKGMSGNGVRECP